MIPSDSNSKNFRCLDIFAPEEQKVLIKYRKENFKEKELVYRERRLIGKCPLTPEEVNCHSLEFLFKFQILDFSPQIGCIQHFVIPFPSNVVWLWIMS